MLFDFKHFEAISAVQKLPENGTFLFPPNSRVMYNTQHNSVTFIGPSAVDKDQDSGSFLEATVHQQPPQQGQISIPMMLAIIGLSITSILMLIILATCYIRQKRSPKSSQSGSATGKQAPKQILKFPLSVYLPNEEIQST